MKPWIKIETDSKGHPSLRTNIPDKEAVRQILSDALKAFGQPMVYGGIKYGSEESDIRRPFPRNGKGCPFPK